MRSTVKWVLMAVVLSLSACGKTDPSFSDGRLHGVWVHTETKTDTIDFEVMQIDPQGPKHTFELRRANEIGPIYYEYLIDGDSIRLRSLVSSDSRSHAYYFKLNGDGRSLLIGSFAPFTGGLLLNKFERIR